MTIAILAVVAALVALRLFIRPPQYDDDQEQWDKFFNQ